MKTSSVVVAVDDSRLGRALEVALVAFLPEFEVERRPARGTGEIVVTTPASCSPERCRELVLAGARVIVISPLAPISERDRYEESGAFRYLPMVINATSELANAVRMAAVETYSPPLTVTAAAAACSHDGSPTTC